jgi:hypothetical protein
VARLGNAAGQAFAFVPANPTRASARISSRPRTMSEAGGGAAADGGGAGEVLSVPENGSAARREHLMSRGLGRIERAALAVLEAGDGKASRPAVPALLGGATA